MLKRFIGRAANSITYKPYNGFSQIDRYLGRLEKPLYYYIIGANVGVFVLWNIPAIDQNFMYNNFTLSQFGLQRGRLHTLITHAFSHYNLIHCGFNMMTLYFFGRAVEYNFGSKRLLSLYLAGVIGGVLFSNLGNGQNYLGASAALNSIITYYICNFPRQTMLLFFLPVPAWALGLLILFQSYHQASFNGGHLGGMIAGAGMYFLTRGRYGGHF